MTPDQKSMLKSIQPDQVAMTELAGEPVIAIENTAPGGGPLGGVRVRAKNGWFAARPSGTEDVYKIYAESFLEPAHLERIQAEAQAVVSHLLQASKI